MEYALFGIVSLFTVLFLCLIKYYTKRKKVNYFSVQTLIFFFGFVNNIFFSVYSKASGYLHMQHMYNSFFSFSGSNVFIGSQESL